MVKQNKAVYSGKFTSDKNMNMMLNLLEIKEMPNNITKWIFFIYCI